MQHYATLVQGTSYTVGSITFKQGVKMPVSKDLADYLSKKPGVFKVDFPKYKIPNIKMEPCRYYGDDAMNIAIAYSPNWSNWVRIAVYSLFKNNPPPVRVYLLSDKLGNIDLSDICAKFGEGYSYEYINVDKIFRTYIPSDINVDGRFTKYTLYRLLIPGLILEDRLLYIDADAIVTKDIRDFYYMDLGENLIAGVLDIGIGPFLKNIDFESDDIYINAGVTLMDLNSIRELNLMEKWLMMVNTQFYDCHDQDILNITCKGRVALVPNRYNVSISTGLQVRDQAINIMHYAGPKPWDDYPNTPKRNVWNEISTMYDSMGFNRIPKKIHYAWFGKGPKPEKIQKCIDSWKVVCPDYEIIEWNESNFDVNSNSYTKEAYKSKKYAFVNDYLRLWTLHNFGGLYLDSDVELLKPMDRFLVHRAFTGRETKDILVTATMGSEPCNPWIGKLLSHYNSCKFEIKANTGILTELTKPLFIQEDQGILYMRYGLIIYPVETFCPYDHTKLEPVPTEESYAIHHFAGTWIGRTKV